LPYFQTKPLFTLICIKSFVVEMRKNSIAWGVFVFSMQGK